MKNSGCLLFCLARMEKTSIYLSALKNTVQCTAVQMEKREIALYNVMCLEIARLLRVGPNVRYALNLFYFRTMGSIIFPYALIFV